MELCDICGDLKSSGFIQKLDCNHEFHYECILKSFKSSKDYKNTCPICRQQQYRLPIVNGLKKLDPKVHKIDQNIVYENLMCQTVLKTGKNKGNKCDKHCKLGYLTCQRHFKSS